MAIQYTYKTINADEITALDLTAELTINPNQVECARVCIDGLPEQADAIYFPRIGRGAVAWGADAVWTDGISLEDVIDRWLRDDTIA